ncbi:protein MEI2-like 4 [Trifolium pratense]|uniref:protein MEI2-like 4 n=1 Tax=Trifolium pratense TaxID=57577 RepID=UPI001E691543|nr:protein MEI2-like 4 [Trifolium pratense]XP_045798292.1 protein MEI2-like 4 [Trifolium pratense]
MPCETMDFNNFSSSSMFSSDDICSSTERETGWWKFGKTSKDNDSDQGTKPIQAVSNFSDGNEVNIIAPPRESSLFSSSLSDLFSRKLRLSANASHYEEEKLVDSLEELEAQIIGNLLPNEDDLLSGVTDWNDHIVRDSTGDDIDELDFFSSVGGLELEDVDNSFSGEKNSKIIGRAQHNQLGLCNTSIAGENPVGEHSSRTLLVKNIDSDVKDSVVKALFEQFGDIHTFYRACKHQGLAMISYYDIRASQNAMRALHNRLFGRRKFEIHFSIPKIHPEFKQECNLCLHQKSPLTTSFQGLHGISSSVPSTLPSVIKVKSVGNQCEFTESSSPVQLNFDTQAALAFHPHSLPERRHGFTNDVHHNPLEVTGNINLKTQERIDNMQFCQVKSNGPFMDFDECVSKSSGNISSSFPLSGHHDKWSNSYPPPRTMWPNSPFGGTCAVPTLQSMNQLPMSPSHMITTVLPTNNHHVQSPPLWDRRYTYAVESVTPHCVEFVPHNMFPHFGLNFHNQRGMMFPGRNHMVNNSFDAHKRVRSRRNVGTSNLADLKRYELDIDCIMRGEDNRTTLMIKNIPNKYTSVMLLATINERHKGTYDFVYLPIDFKNKCNVGYAFINMTSPSSIVPFYQVFNGKKWEFFNSEKVASLAYARIQGKTALIAHFQNSSLMNVDERCRPILIDTDGPNAGDQVPFPIAMKPGRVRNNIHEEDNVSKESD